MFLLLFLFGCDHTKPETYTEQETPPIYCFQGVQYYVMRENVSSGRRGFMAPVYDKVTQKVKLCEEGTPEVR